MVFTLVLGVAQASEKARVAFIAKGYHDTYCLLVMEIFRKYAEEKYADLYTVDYFDGETNADKINTLIETATANQYDVIIFQQEDADAPVAPVKAAVAAGIHVILTVGKINDDGESYFIDCDPKQQGLLVAEFAVDQGKLKEGTKVAILQGPAGQFHSNLRTEAFREVVEQVGANLVAQEIAEWRTNLAQDIVENWLVAFPDLEVILAANDDMALGALEAMKLANNDKIFVVGVDANEEGCLALKRGTLKASVAQDTFGYAHGAADFAAELISSKGVVIIPCADFGCPMHIRVSYAASIETITEGMDRLESFVKEYWG
jgi:ABC-type sugar transport system substrate-binding protein